MSYVIGVDGVKFPATEVPSNDDNTLTDAQRGTFTPTLTFGGGSTGMTFTAQAGFYRKVGWVVFFTLRLTLSAKGSSTGSAVIGGLPFTALSTSNSHAPVEIQRYENVTAAGHMAGHISPSGTSISLFNIASGGAATALTDTAFANTSDVMVSGFYFAS